MSASHILIATSPCSVFVSGSTYQVSAGEKLTLKPEEAQQILTGPYSSRFVDQGVVELQSNTLSEQALAAAKGEPGIQLKIPGIEEQLYQARLVEITSKDSDSYTPSPSGEVNAQALLEEAQQEADSLMQQLASKVAVLEPEVLEPEVVKETEEEQEEPKTLEFKPKQLEFQLRKTGGEVGPASIEVKESIKIPFDSDVHYSTVRQFILDKEAAADPHLFEYAEAVKEKYPNYKSVVQECNRILKANTKTS